MSTDDIFAHTETPPSHVEPRPAFLKTLQQEAPGLGEMLDRIRAALADRYEVEREIGRGGMAVVYLARDLQLGRQVAIKVIRPELAQAVGLERFLREVRIEAALDHPNIVALFDSGEADGLPYYVMPYVEGESLRQRLQRENRLSLVEALRITSAIADGLSYAHERGVIHKDIKPENILLSEDRVLIADFGIAKATTEAGGEALTTYGIVLGTPEYMSPEQATGEKVDSRSDIYALGCVVYEMLGGDPPFTGRTRSVIVAKHIQENVPSLKVVRKNVPYGVRQAVEKALEKVPADRYQTAVDLAEGLQGGVRIPQPPPPLLPTLLKAMVAAIAISVAVLAAIFWPDPPVPLDDRRVLNLPMRETGFDLLSPGVGRLAALAVGSALEQTDPLQFEWGERWLNPAERDDISQLSATTADSIARLRGARYRIDSEVAEVGSRASVILWLYDVSTSELIIQLTQSGIAHQDSIVQLALRGTAELLPYLLTEPGREVDRVAFLNHDPAASALAILGEEAYRRSRYAEAYELYGRAVEKDSSMAMAALKGAQAASWLKDYDDAELLVSVALDHASVLPSRYESFARGLRDYLVGQADSAVHWLTDALHDVPDWKEAHYALGEVYYHLLPSAVNLDSLATSSFEAAIRSDSGFSPPLYHLSHIAIRAGELDHAAMLIDLFRSFEPEGRFVPPLELALDCVRESPEDIPWEQHIQSSARAVYQAAKALSVGLHHASCAEAGLRWLLASDSTMYHWGAFMGLQGILAAQHREPELIVMIDSATAAGELAAMTLYLVDAMAGADLEAKALGVEEYGDRWGEDYERFTSFGDAFMWVAWLYGSWHAQRNDTSEVAALENILAERATDTGNPEFALYADALAAHLMLLNADTAGAIDGFGVLTSLGDVDSLSSEFGLSLPVERLRLAELLCAQQMWQECIDAASVFDHPGPLIYLPFVKTSLVLRHDAAQRIGNAVLERQYRTRLDELAFANPRSGRR